MYATAKEQLKLVHNRGFSVHYTDFLVYAESASRLLFENDFPNQLCGECFAFAIRQRFSQPIMRRVLRMLLIAGALPFMRRVLRMRPRTSYKRSKCHDSGCHNMKRQIEAFSLPKLNCGRKSCRQKKENKALGTSHRHHPHGGRRRRRRRHHNLAT